YGFQQQLDTQVADIYTEYIFPSIAAYTSALTGVNPYAYSTFNASVGQPGAWYHSFFWNLFAQDSWQITPKLLATYGVRYDKFSGPSGDPEAIFPYSQHFRSPSGDFAPRLGIAWSINQKTVLRVNSGIFYEAPPTNLWYNALYNDGGSSSYSASISGSAPGAPPFPESIVNGTLPRSSSNLYTITPNFKDAYAINSSIQITRQLFRNDALTVGYVNTAGRNLEYLRNINLINPTSYLADGRPVYSTKVSAATRLDPAVNNIALEDTGDNSSYNALIVNYAHRLSAGLAMNASYTWSHSIDDAPEANTYDGSIFTEDPTDRNRDRGNSIINRPDAFTMSAVYAPSFNGIGNRVWRYLADDNQLTTSFVAQSGDEQNIIANTTLDNDALAGTSANRPLYVGRNTVRGPSIYQVDLRYSRTFFKLWEKLAPTFFIEANNVLNHPNISALNDTAVVNSLGVITKAPTFAPVSTVLEGRIVQLGVRADW
ncbi:MAG: TonB-dependent receptor, partial [Bryobacteraceae bacterium]